MPDSAPYREWYLVSSLSSSVCFTESSVGSRGRSVEGGIFNRFVRIFHSENSFFKALVPFKCR